MKFSIKPTAAAIFLLGASASMAAFAEDTVNKNVMVEARVYDMNDKVSHLEAKIEALKMIPVVKTPKMALVDRGFPYTAFLTDTRSPTGKDIELLKARARGELVDSAIYVSGEARPRITYKRFHESVGSNQSPGTHLYEEEAQLDRAALGILGQVGEGLVTYLQGTYTHKAALSSSFDLDHAYLLWGDLNKSPFYFLIGKDELPFGHFKRVSPLSVPLTDKVFKAAPREQFRIGYVQDDWSVAAAVFKGDSPTTIPSFNISGPDETTRPYTSAMTLGFDNSTSRVLTPNNNNQIGNFALNTSYKFKAWGTDVMLGASYLSGSAFISDESSMNPAIDLYGSFKSGQIRANLEYIQTLHNTGTATKVRVINGTVANLQGNSIFHAWSASLVYMLPVSHYDTQASFSISQVRPDPKARVDQAAIGYSANILENVSLGVEYEHQAVYNSAASAETHNQNLISIISTINF